MVEQSPFNGNDVGSIPAVDIASFSRNKILFPPIWCDFNLLLNVIISKMFMSKYIVIKQIEEFDNG